MTDLSAAKFVKTQSQDWIKRRTRFDLEETHWGYVVRSTDRPGMGVQLTQVLAMLSGGAFAASSLGLVLLPNFLSGGVDFALRAGAAVIFAGLAAFLLYYASRGTMVELHIDTNQGEVREVVRNRAGRPSQIGRYGFDSIGGVHIDRTGQATGNAALCLRYQNTAQTVLVAFGYVTDLEALKDRLGQDLIIGANT